MSHHHLFPLPILNSKLTFFLCILITVAVLASRGDGDVDERFTSCQTTRKCGRFVQDIKYPFWGINIRPQYCGRQGFELQCHGDHYAIIDIGGQTFEVIDINDARQIMVITKHEFLEGNFSCPLIFQETRIDNNALFSYSENVRSLSLFFECSDPLTHHLSNNTFSCQDLEGGGVKESFYRLEGEENASQFPNLSMSCSKVIKVPIQNTQLNNRYLMEGKLLEAVSLGFEVRYGSDSKSCSECSASQGICGSNQTSNEFLCLCQSRAYHDSCLARTRIFIGSNSGQPVKVVIGVIGAIMGMIIICMLFRIRRWRKNSTILSTVCCRTVTTDENDLEAFIRNHGPLATKRYKFSNVKRMTNSFKNELGQGGYGSVYKGKLSDGRLVAVKLLKTSKGNGQEFVNEVASISRTSHVNVVTLLGFCLEGSKRALIYEFMPNGSLEKFIYREDASKPSREYLGWDKMYEILIGIAKGLEYLHRGCNTRILHFDIKPHNILLDQEFVPKISDFGLAKLCLEKESIVSMLEARGTIGYIAPEVFNRNFGVVSHKSDVYSYGMMIMELVGCKNKVHSGIDHSSEVYFPHWIYRHVEQGREFNLPGVVTGEERKVVMRMILVALWCIQTRPSDRPPMNRVLEMLQGSTEPWKSHQCLSFLLQ